MRVIVIGATGNVGTSLLSSLRSDPTITSIVGVARRRPDTPLEGVEWRTADIATDDLGPVVRDADAVVHLGWLLQPSRDQAEQWATNVVGTRRLLDAVARTGVGSFVYASSIAAYSPAAPGQLVDEMWPTDGIATSPYSRQKAYNERVLDAFEAANPQVRVVRLRPGLIVKPGAATQIRRLFTGPFMPTTLIRALGMPIWPATRGLELQFVHSDDAGEAYRLAVTSDVRGPFNIAADPVMDADTAAEALGAIKLRLPAPVLRAAAAATWRLRLQPTDPGWIDLAVGAPLMKTDRAREVLGWKPTVSADRALAEFVEAFGRGEDYPTPPLDGDSSGPGRINELRTGVGGTTF